jgi:hypothetical protein
MIYKTRYHIREENTYTKAGIKVIKSHELLIVQILCTSKDASVLFLPRQRFRIFFTGPLLFPIDFQKQVLKDGIEIRS